MPRAVFQELEHDKPFSTFAGGIDVSRPLRQLDKPLADADSTEFLDIKALPIDKQHQSDFRKLQGEAFTNISSGNIHNASRSIKKLAQNTKRLKEDPLSFAGRTELNYNKRLTGLEAEKDRAKKGTIEGKDIVFTDRVNLHNYNKQGGAGKQTETGEFIPNEYTESFSTPDKIDEAKLIKSYGEGFKDQLSQLDAGSYPTSSGFIRTFAQKRYGVKPERVTQYVGDKMLGDENWVKRAIYEESERVFNAQGRTDESIDYIQSEEGQAAIFDSVQDRALQIGKTEALKQSKDLGDKSESLKVNPYEFRRTGRELEKLDALNMGTTRGGGYKIEGNVEEINKQIENVNKVNTGNIVAFKKSTGKDIATLSNQEIKELSGTDRELYNNYLVSKSSKEKLDNMMKGVENESDFNIDSSIATATKDYVPVDYADSSSTSSKNIASGYNVENDAAKQWVQQNKDLVFKVLREGKGDWKDTIPLIGQSVFDKNKENINEFYKQFLTDKGIEPIIGKISKEIGYTDDSGGFVGSGLPLRITDLVKDIYTEYHKKVDTNLERKTIIKPTQLHLPEGKTKSKFKQLEADLLRGAKDIGTSFNNELAGTTGNANQLFNNQKQNKIVDADNLEEFEITALNLTGLTGSGGRQAVEIHGKDSDGKIYKILTTSEDFGTTGSGVIQTLERIVTTEEGAKDAKTSADIAFTQHAGETLGMDLITLQKTPRTKQDFNSFTNSAIDTDLEFKDKSSTPVFKYRILEDGKIAIFNPNTGQPLELQINKDIKFKNVYKSWTQLSTDLGKAMWFKTHKPTVFDTVLEENL